MTDTLTQPLEHIDVTVTAPGTADTAKQAEEVITELILEFLSLRNSEVSAKITVSCLVGDSDCVSWEVSGRCWPHELIAVRRAVKHVVMSIDTISRSN